MIDAPIIAERFLSPVAGLSSLVLPLDVVAASPRPRLRIVVAPEASCPQHRTMVLAEPAFRPGESLRLLFEPFDTPAGAPFVLGVVGELPTAPGGEAPHRVPLEELRAAAADRRPIWLECRGGDPSLDDGRLLPGHGAIAAVRLVRSPIRTAYGLDAFWCDADGMYLQGWIHAFERRVRSFEVSAGGGSVRLTELSDRSDLLAHYPGHEHVRLAGFAIYLECPPGHRPRFTVETDDGIASYPVELPHGPLPAWPRRQDQQPAASTAATARFAELASALGGTVLELGTRTASSELAEPDRDRRGLLRGLRVVGLDIHPGYNVDLVGDALGLTSFLRRGSVAAVYSSSVLEHIEVPWLLAAEVNRVLRPRGVVLHVTPAAWPVHSEPNDFWRFSARGLGVLFGAQTGFEPLAAGMEAPMVMIPAPAWRAAYLDMPTVRAFGMSFVLARKVRELADDAVTWPTDRLASESRARQYPVDGLARPRRGDPLT